MAEDISIPTPTYRVPRHSSGMDPATRRLALIAAGMGATLLAAVGGWTMLNHPHHGVPVVEADSGPMRVRPTNPGGLQVAGVNNDIFSGGSDTDVEKLAPPPQTPDPEGLRAPPARPAPATPPAAAPAPLAATQPPPEPATALADRAPAATRAPVAATTVLPLARPGQKPASAPAAEHSAGSRAALVQLAALSSEEAAKAEWQQMVKRWPEFFAGRQPAFSRVERAGQTLWRVRTGGFEDVSQATTFCARLRSKGGGCSVADF